MSNIGWALAATHYNIKLPNEPRLGWSKPQYDFIQLTALAAVAAAFLYGVFTPTSTLLEISVAVGIVVLMFFAIVVWPLRKSVANIQSVELTLDELKCYAIQVQHAALASNSKTQDPSMLGGQLIQRWTIPLICGLSVVLIVFWPPPVYISIVVLASTLGRVGVATLCGSRWIATFKDRIQRHACVGCGYQCGEPGERLTVCPECNVILPPLTSRDMKSQPSPIRSTEASYE